MLGLIVVSSDAFAYSIESSSVTILPAITNSDSSTGSFQVESNLVVIASPHSNYFEESVVVPEDEPTVITSSGGGGGRYDASNWILKKKYDELVALRDAEKPEEFSPENFYASAPEILPDPDFPEQDPVMEESSVPVVVDRVDPVNEIDETVGDPVSPGIVAPIIPEVVPSNDQMAASEPIISDADVPVVSEPTELVAVDAKTFFKPISPLYFGETESPKMTCPTVQKPTGFTWRVFHITYAEESISDDFVVEGSLFPDRITPLSLIIIELLILFVLMYVHQRYIIRKLKKELKECCKKKTVSKKPCWKEKLKKFIFWGLAIAIPMLTTSTVFAGEVTTPNEIYYQGALKDDNGQYLNGSYDFRFSLWSTQDFIENTDVIGGEIQLGAAFFGWSEIQSLDISNGKFYFEVGSAVPFPEDVFHSLEVYLQVEIKSSTDPVTSFEFIDIDASDPVEDRMGFTTVPYARNSDELDYRDTGFEPGNIPYLDDEGKLNESMFPSNSMFPTGTNEDFFTIDNDDSVDENGSIDLVFGKTLAKTLSYNRLSDAFEFNDSVSISGNLVVTGTINGRSFHEQTVTDVLSPRYKNAVFVADGTENAGAMHEEVEESAGKSYNHFRWSTKSSTPQDYDIQVKYTLPADFAGFEATDQIGLVFKTDGAVSSSNINFTIEKEGDLGNDQAEGAGLGLANSGWLDDSFSLNSVTVWSPGDTMVFKIKLTASKNSDARISDIKISYKK